MTGRRQRLGAAGERVAAEWYAAAGYRVVATNWRCREGELDLIVERRGEIVFCEVKTRSGTGFGLPAEAVGHDKQRRLRRLAARWLRESGRRPRRVRFDVASVLWPRGEHPSIDVIEAAF